MEKKQTKFRVLIAKVFGFSCLALTLFSCQNISFNGKGNDVPTSGEIVMAIDYGDSFVMNEELEMFHLEYPKAKIIPHYMCEVNLLRQLEMDSFRFVVMNRDFTNMERENLEKRDFKIRSATIGKTAIAVIVAKDFIVDSLSQKQLRAIMNGEITDWRFQGSSAPMQIVFDQGCGSNYAYFTQNWFSVKKPNGKISEKQSPRAVINYVAQNPGAIGFVNVNWLSDNTDLGSKALAGLVKALAIDNPQKPGFHLPYQSQIVTGQYPFVQTIYMHDLQGYSGLAQGFIAYVSSQPGQILMKKSGLIPAHDMGRTIELVEE